MRRVPYNCTSTAVPLTRDINLLGSGRTHGGPYPGFPDQNLEGVNRKPNHQSDKHICRSMIAIQHVFGTANLNTTEKGVCDHNVHQQHRPAEVQVHLMNTALALTELFHL